MTMLDDIVGLPDQLRWGIDLDPQPVHGSGPIVILGVGGSAMAGSVATLAASPRAPIVVHRGYGLPPWAVDSGAAVIAVSYSGNTEEVLSGVDAAIAEGLPLAAVSSGGRLEEVALERSLPYVAVPGGIQPRAAVGYQAAAVAAMLAAVGQIADVNGDLIEAADALDELLDGGRGGAVVLGRDIAEGLVGRTAIIYGGKGIGSTAAYRWKTQINENAKSPAFSGTIPEMNHNELEGWRPGESEGFGLVYLRDEGDHPAIARRLDLSGIVLSGAVPRVGEVRSSGTGPLARFFSLAVVGDIASVAMADQAGIDSTEVEKLEEFKIMLAKGTS